MNEMTSTQTIETQTRKQFDVLCESLNHGIACEVGEYLIHSVRSCSTDGKSFDANVTDSNGRTFQAQVRVSLAQYENLLGNKIDVAIVGPKINQTLNDSTFTIHS